MTHWQKREFLSLFVWCLAAVGFVYSFLSVNGPAGFVDDSFQRNLAGGFIAAGIIGQSIIGYLMRRREKSNQILVDERDERIMRRALEIVYPILAIIIFLTCIILHDFYQESGNVPVGWIWFIAYIVFILTYLSKSLGFLVFYYWANKHGER